MFGFLIILLAVAFLMLLGEWLHWIYRAPRLPLRPTSQALSELFVEVGNPRYSIRHLEKFFLLGFVWFCLFLILLTGSQGRTFEYYFYSNSVSPFIAAIAGVGVWWAFRRGVMR